MSRNLINAITIGLPVDPCTLIDQGTHRVTKITRETTGGMAGGRATYYGKITSQTDQFTIIEDIILGESISIGNRYIQEVRKNVTIAMLHVDSPEHANFQAKKFNSKQSITWYELPKATKITWAHDFQAGKDSRLIEINVTRFES